MFARHKTYRLYRKTKNKILNVAVILAMVVSSLSGATPLFWGNTARAANNGITYGISPTSMTSNQSTVVTVETDDNSDHTVTIYKNSDCTGDILASATGKYKNDPFTANIAGSVLGVGAHTLGVQVVKQPNNTVKLSCNNDSLLAVTVTAPAQATAPDMPVHLSPDDNSIQNFNNFYFDWTDVDGAVEYEFQSATSPVTDDTGALTTGVWNNKLHGAPDRDFLSNSTIHSYGANGTWWWQVRAIDGDGNKSSWTTPWKMTIDMTAPSALEITYPTEGQYFTSAPILNQWTAATDGSGIKTYQIAYHYDDGHTFSGSTCSGLTMPGYSGFIGCRDLTGTQRNHTPASNEQGGVTIWVRAQDNAGNWSAWSSPVHYYYDATPPSVPILLSPANGVPVNGSNPIANDWTDVADAHHYIYESYNVDSNGNCIMSPIRFNSTHTESKTNSRVLADGLKFCWRVKAVDAAGNESAWSDLWVTIADNTAPVIEINGTTPKATYKMNEPIDVHVIDANFDRVEVDRIDSAAPDNDKHWTYTGEWFGLWWLQDGTYRLTAYDKAGNTTIHEFITDETRPVVTGSAEPDFNPAGLTITATDANSGVQRVTGNIYRYDPAHPNADSEGYYLFKSNSSTTQNPFTVALDGLDEGQYYVKYNAQDMVGNTSNTEKFYFTIDHTAPVVAVDTYTGTDTTPDITGTIDDLSITTVTVTVNGESYDVTPVAGAWTLLGSDLVAPLAVGTYDVIASATDAAGNTGTDATTDEVTVEALPPAPDSTNGPQIQGAFTSNQSNQNQGGNGNQNRNFQNRNTFQPEEIEEVTDEQSVLSTTDSNPGGDEKNTELVEKAASTQGKFLGLGWWWLAVLGALAILWLLLFGRRASEDKN